MVVFVLEFTAYRSCAEMFLQGVSPVFAEGFIGWHEYPVFIEERLDPDVASYFFFHERVSDLYKAAQMLYVFVWDV